MTDTLVILKERIAKAEAKAVRARKSLENAEKELSDLTTTLRVMRELAGESEISDSPNGSVAVSARQQQIIDLLNVGFDNSVSPVELFRAYSAQHDDNISIDTFRTTLWRMKKEKREIPVGTQNYRVESDGGRYWKAPLISPSPLDNPPPWAQIQRPLPRNDFGDDDDIPF